jgi:O-antigen/teichoic acid export membrane protein
VAIGPVALLLNMTKYNKVNLFDLVLSILLSLVLDFYLIPRLGAIGAAIASALSIIFISTLRLGQIYRAFRIQPFGLSYFKPIFAGIVAITLSFLLGLLLADLSYYLHILIVSSALLLSYTGALLLLRLEKTDRVVLNTILRRIGFVYPIS